MRLIGQRMRHRVMEALEPLAEGEEGARSVGVVEYVEMFLDFINDDIPWRWREWSIFTSAEVAALEQVHDLLVRACDDTPGIDEVEAFILSGWPRRLQPPASKALGLMTARGRFSEDVEEDEPSQV